MFQSTARQESFLGLPKTQQDPLELPGYKLPLDYSPMRSNVYGVLGRSLFPTALDDRDIQRGYAEYVKYLRNCILNANATVWA